jgi:hypothetical protein
LDDEDLEATAWGEPDLNLGGDEDADALDIDGMEGGAGDGEDDGEGGWEMEVWRPIRGSNLFKKLTSMMICDSHDLLPVSSGIMED